MLYLFFYQKDLEKYQRLIKRTKNKNLRDEAQKYFDALKRALEKADGLDEIFYKHIAEKYGKYIVFCANVEHMQEMITKVPEWFSKIDVSLKIYTAYSYNP